MGSGYTIKALDESSWDAFAGLVEANNGVFGGCWCMGFHPDDSREPALNRERKLARVRAGRAHAALVFDGDDCVGWCQFGAPDEVPKIKNRAAYEKSLTTLPDWRIACNFVGKGHRRQGVATAALDGALDLIARLGGGKVEGYPEAAGSVPAGFLFNGALSTYEKLGFVRDRKIGKHRWVVTKVVEPTSYRHRQLLSVTAVTSISGFGRPRRRTIRDQHGRAACASQAKSSSRKAHRGRPISYRPSTPATWRSRQSGLRPPPRLRSRYRRRRVSSGAAG